MKILLASCYQSLSWEMQSHYSRKCDLMLDQLGLD